MRNKLTNKDKRNIKDAMYAECENILYHIADKTGKYDELFDIEPKTIINYCLKIIFR